MNTFLKKIVFDHLPKLVVLGWLLVAGCASPNTGGWALDPVGPAPGGLEIGRNGMLVVYTTYNLQKSAVVPHPNPAHDA